MKRIRLICKIRSILYPKIYPNKYIFDYILCFQANSLQEYKKIISLIYIDHVGRYHVCQMTLATSRPPSTFHSRLILVSIESSE